jgi:hypothetical protein
MCRYLLNIVDVKKLEPEKKRTLLKYLEERKAELSADLAKLDDSLMCVEKALAEVRRTEKIVPSRLMEVMP